MGEEIEEIKRGDTAIKLMMPNKAGDYIDSISYPSLASALYISRYIAKGYNASAEQQGSPDAMINIGELNTMDGEEIVTTIHSKVFAMNTVILNIPKTLNTNNLNKHHSNEESILKALDETGWTDFHLTQNMLKPLVKLTEFIYHKGGRHNYNDDAELMADFAIESEINPDIYGTDIQQAANQRMAGTEKFTFWADLAENKINIPSSPLGVIDHVSNPKSNDNNQYQGR